MLAGNVERINYIDKLVANDIFASQDGYYNPSGQWVSSKLYADQTWEGEKRKEWENWSKMHNNGVIWFDTSACMDAQHIANVNKPSLGNKDYNRVIPGRPPTPRWPFPTTTTMTTSTCTATSERPGSR